MNLRILLLLCFLLPATAAAQSDTAGSAACANCHSQAKTQPTTSMGHALESVETCKVLIDHPLLATTVGSYSYRIERKGRQSDYSVTDGITTLTLPIRWAMGASSAIGQTYILEKDGQLFESRVSYFREINGLGPTLGSVGHVPADLHEAVGRLMSRDDKLKCFGCHSTHAVSGRQLTLEQLIPGVQCAHCHDDADAHLAAVLVNGAADSDISTAASKLHGMPAEQAANFCGQCHRTWAEIAAQGNPSIANIRFQPYRLTGSKCFDPDDPRISCLACHDPHHELSAQPVDYDSKCLACHPGGKANGSGIKLAVSAGKPGAKACPVAASNCSTCHMPKFDLPGAHYKFSDHRIRIVKPNEPYPG